MGADGSLYYLARGSGSATGVVYRVEYVGPRVDVTANGQDGPVVLGEQDPLVISVEFDAGNASTIDPGEVYIGVASVLGTVWLDPATQTFVPTPTRVYTGPLPSVGPTTLINVPNVSGIATGPYWWFMIVDSDSNGAPNGTFFDVVLTIVP